MSGRELHWSEVTGLHDHFPFPPGVPVVSKCFSWSLGVSTVCRKVSPQLVATRSHRKSALSSFWEAIGWPSSSRGCGCSPTNQLVGQDASQGCLAEQPMLEAGYEQ
jgi:hypothetical protein